MHRERITGGSWLVAVQIAFELEHAHMHGFVEQQLEQIVVEREAENLTTIFTTNLTGEQAAERLGDRMIDRLSGPWAIWVNCGGPNLRTRQ